MTSADEIIDAQPDRRRWGAQHGLRESFTERAWTLSDGTRVLDPAFDYSRGKFVGRTDGGAEVSLDFSRDLLPQITSQVNGWCTRAQGYKLHDLAAEQASAGCRIVELGTARGLSATWIGWAAKAAGATMLCVDLFDGSPYGSDKWAAERVLADWHRNIDYAGLRDTCVPLRSDSVEAGRRYEGEPVSLLYVDGLHTYRGCRDDILTWLPHLRADAIVAVDDCDRTYPGILRVMRELADRPDFELLGRVDFMLYWRYRGRV